MFGVPELRFFLVLAVGWLVPIVAGVWALMTLYRLREGQTAIAHSARWIERLLQRPEVVT